jgi:sodium/bile acid cotransporter 7
LKKYLPDSYSIALLSTVGLATLLPIQGHAAEVFSTLTKLAVALLFFLNGAKLSREAVIAGITHWRLHLTVTASTYAIFPLFGIIIAWGLPDLLGQSLSLGFLYLCCLPSTVQSSVAFTSIAKGNVPAAICSATLSNLIGIILTPALVGLLLSAHGGAAGLDAVLAIVEQLLLPFAAGQIVRPLLAKFLHRHSKLISMVDRGSILMVVYGAFSEAVSGGLWSNTAPSSLGMMFLVATVLLIVVLVITTWASRAFGFSLPDRIAIIFCGSKKSMASGVPMASILFPAASVGSIVLPVMIFHQIQLMACAWIARRYAAQYELEHTH